MHVAGDRTEPDADASGGNRSETPCEPELLLFARKNDKLHSAGLLEPSRSGEPA